jgi:predicted nuclease of predicted toxin-antitoxin system
VRWLADECIAASLVASLRQSGHDVLYVTEYAAGLHDANVVDLAMREQRLLLTEDKDFGDLVFRRGRAAAGIVLMRIASENPRLQAKRLATAIDQYGDRLFGQYLVIEEGRFRSRPLWED